MCNDNCGCFQKETGEMKALYCCNNRSGFMVLVKHDKLELYDRFDEWLAELSGQPSTTVYGITMVSFTNIDDYTRLAKGHYGEDRPKFFPVEGFIWQTESIKCLRMLLHLKIAYKQDSDISNYIQQILVRLELSEPKCQCFPEDFAIGGTTGD